MKRVGLLAIGISLLTVTWGVAQEGSGNQNREERQLQTIEELYLSQDVEMQILRSQALSNDRDSKMLALQSLRSMVQDGGATATRDEVLLLLDTLATEGTRRTVRSGGAVLKNYPEIRRQAVNLMGEIGGDAVENSLIGVLEADTEPMVLAEAVYALGRIEDDRESRTLDHIARVLARENIKQMPDNNLAFASLLAIEKIAERTDGINNPELLDTLLGVTSGNYIRDVRLKAINVIYGLRGSSSGSAN